MIELADIFRRFGVEYRQRFAVKLLPSHRRAMHCIENCRTATLGGHLFPCVNCNCGHKHYEYHSCNNRACPKCGHKEATKWLEKQSEKLLFTIFYMVTFTVPSELRSFARSNQDAFFKLFFQCSSDTLKQLAKASNKVGTHMGIMGVLHTWSRILIYHPHIHYIVTGGGLSDDCKKWKPSPKDFLFNVNTLSSVFRAKMRDGFIERGWDSQVPKKVWTINWVVNCEPKGSGVNVFKYLSRYVFRTAMSNKRIQALNNRKVTFSYIDSDTNKPATKCYDVIKFMGLFLQHVLPRGFMRVRHYGLFHHSQKDKLLKAAQLIGRSELAICSRESIDPKIRLCPKCKHPLPLRPIKLFKIRGPPIAA